MSSSISAAQFLYTSAPFGDQGYDGLQFVGLPADMADREHQSDIERHVNYTAPADAPSSPDDETIRAAFPVAYRMLRLGDSSAAVLAARYGGQVYHDGRRGKWGNTFTHALVLDRVDVHLAELARGVDWRTHLTESELEEGKPIQLERLPLPRSSSGATAADPEDEALVAAILARVHAGPSVVLADIHHDELLAQFARVQRLLPKAIEHRLSWSTYETDGGSGFDVIGTTGATRLSADLDGYNRPGVTPVDPVFDWAARTLVSGDETFWAEVEVLGGFADYPSQLKGALTWCQRLREARLDTAAASSIIERLECRAPNIAHIEIARRWSRSLLDDGGARDFIQGNARKSLANRLTAWSGEADWNYGVRNGADDSRIAACFADRRTGGPLAAALTEAVGRGLEPGDVIRMAIDAAHVRLSGGAPIATFAAVLDSVLGNRPGRSLAETPGLLDLLTADRDLWTLAEALIRAEAARHGAGAIGRLLVAIGALAPTFVDERGRELEIDCVANLADAAPDALGWGLSVLESIQPSEWRGPLAVLRPRDLLARLDACIGKLEPCERIAPAKRLAALYIAWSNGLADESIEPVVNTWCVLGSDAPQDASTRNLVEARGSSAATGTVVRERAHRGVFVPFVVYRFRSLDESRPDLIKTTFFEHWRRDVAADVDSIAVDTILAWSKRSRQMVGFVTAELSVAEPTVPVEQAWRSTLWRVSLRLADALDDSGFRDLTVGLPPAWVNALRRRRTRSVRGVGRAIRAGLRGLMGGGKRDRNRE